MSYFQTHKNEFKFFILTGCVIIYSQLYPLHFHSYTADISLIKHYLKDMSLSETGDCFSNIMLFTILGFLGIRAMENSGRKTICILTLFAMGFSFGFLLQFSHFFIYTRNFNLIDVIFSSFAALMGAIIGSLEYFRFFGGRRKDELLLTVPVFLSILWLLSQLAPFIPYAHLSDIKHSFMIFTDQAELSLIETFTRTVFWLLFAHLASSARQKNISGNIFLYIILLTLAAQMFIEGQTLSLGAIAGGFLAIFIWGMGFMRCKSRTSPLIIALILILGQGLFPFKPLMHPGGFSPIPFHGFLSDPTLKGIITIFEKTFMYGSLLWLFEQAGVNLLKSTVFCLLLCGIIECVQLYLPYYATETTDPAIVILMALLIQRHKIQNSLTDRHYNNKERRKK